MDSHITGTTAAGIEVGGPATAGISTASPTASAGSPSTEPTQQDWLEILLGLAAQLEFPAVRLRVDQDGRDKFLHAIVLMGVVEREGALKLEK